MTRHYFLLETLSIFLGDVLASAFIALFAYAALRVIRHPGFRVGASWSYTGWNVRAAGRFPNASDLGLMEFTPRVNITSYDDRVRKIIHSIWVRERADVSDPGTIWGHRDLHRDGVPAEIRTTGGDPINIEGPTIPNPASKFHEIVNCPIFIQTTDGNFYKAESVGNTATGVIRLRYRYRNALHSVRQQFFSMRNYIRSRF